MRLYRICLEADHMRESRVNWLQNYDVATTYQGAVNYLLNFSTLLRLLRSLAAEYTPLFRSAGFLNLFRSLGRLKRETPALRAGDVRVMRAGGGVFAFRRSLRSAEDLPTETVVCYVNRSGGPIFVPARHALLAQNASRTDGGFELSPGGFGCFAE